MYNMHRTLKLRSASSIRLKISFSNPITQSVIKEEKKFCAMTRLSIVHRIT